MINEPLAQNPLAAAAPGTLCPLILHSTLSPSVLSAPCLQEDSFVEMDVVQSDLQKRTYKNNPYRTALSKNMTAFSMSMLMIQNPRKIKTVILE